MRPTQRSITPSEWQLLNSEPKFARQVEFDALISQITEEGSLLEDACAEVVEILQEDDQDLSYLYVYSTEEEKKDKESLMKNVQTIEGLEGGDARELSLCAGV